MSSNLNRLLRKVKVVRCGHSLIWYADRIGEVFQPVGMCTDKGFEGVWVREGGQFNAKNIIYQEDYEVINE